MKKYEIDRTDKIRFLGNTLYRIRALKNFEGVEKGDLGGYVAGYKNLSQKGNSWVKAPAMVLNNAKILDNATVSGPSVVGDEAQIYNEMRINGALIYGTAKVYGKTWVGMNFTMKEGVWHPDSSVQKLLQELIDKQDFTTLRTVLVSLGLGE